MAARTCETGLLGYPIAAVCWLSPAVLSAVSTRRARSSMSWANSVAVAGPAASADHGVLDPSFGDGGRVTSDFDTVAFAAGVAVGPDGSVFASGSYGEANLTAFAFTKWRADGSPDPTFGDNGQVHL